MIHKHLFSFIVLLINVNLLAQPDADFSASNLQGCSPLIVNFSDISAGAITKWEWEFGNGNKSFLQDPSATFSNPGLYTVSLIVTDTSGLTDTLIVPDMITVLPAPDAGIQIVGGSEGCVDFTTAFIDITSGGSGSISDWLWDFGDGSVSTMQDPTHVYTFPGVFSVLLQVTDSNGCSDFIVLADTISAYKIPEVSFTADTMGSCMPPLDVSFINTSLGGGNLTYSWDFGDGNSSSALNPSHSYLQSGSYAVKLVVSDSFGCADSLIKDAFITVQPPLAMFDINKHQGCLIPLDSFIFFNQTVPQPAVSIWDFGDGSSSQLNSPTHKYSSMGAYEVTLVAGSYGCLDTISDTIQFQQVIADFIVDTAFQCFPPATFNFTNTSFNAASYEWNFGDGNSDDIENPSYTYPWYGNYNVELKVVSDIGCRDSISMPVTLRGPRARIGFQLDYPCIPADILIIDSTISSLPVVSSTWDLGYTTISGTDTLSLIWDSVGTYSVSLIIEDSAGCIDTSVLNLLLGEQQSGTFTILDDTICTTEKAEFVIDVDTFTEIVWSDGMNPLGTTATTEGNYNLNQGYWFPNATILHNGCPSLLIEPDSGILVQGPEGGLSVSLDCTNELKVEITAGLGGEYSNFYIDPGFGFTIDTLAIDTIYPDTGSYNIILFAIDSASGCILEDTLELSLNQYPIARISASDSVGCSELLSVSFDATASYIEDTSVVAAFWTFGNGDTLSKDPTMSWNEFLKPDGINYENPGFYNAILRIFYGVGCFSLDVITMKVYEHKAEFSLDAGRLCPPTTLSFSDSTFSLAPLSSLIWTINGNDTMYEDSVDFYIPEEGAYEISLYTTDTFGCKSQKTKYYVMNAPKADFLAPVTDNCIDDLVLFYNLSIGQQLTPYWEFGDGSSSVVENPIKVYSYGDSFTVKLIVTDINGCKDSLVRQDYIVINEPVAAFSATPDSGSCPPLLVQFNDESSGQIASWSWDLGNGTQSSSQNPVHNYSTSGFFDVKLVVYDQSGCVDSVIIPDYIEIDGPSANFFLSEDSLCPGEQIVLGIYDQKAIDSVLWDLGDGNLLFGDTIIYLYDSSALYNPILVLDNGQSGGSNCIVSIPVGPVYIDEVDASFSFSISEYCIPSLVAIQNNSTNNFIEFWNLNGNDTILPSPWIIDSSGVYDLRLVVESSLGCKDTTTKEFRIFENFKINLRPQDSTVCEGSLIQLNAIDDSTYTYLWSPTEGLSDSTIPNPYVLIDQERFFTIKVTDTSGCENISDTIFIYVQDSISVTAFQDTIIPYDSEVILTAIADQAVSYYSWSPDESLDCTSCNIVTASPSEFTAYVVTVEDTLGCNISRDTVVIGISDNVKVELPDAFSPNNDGINDIVYPKYRGIRELLSFAIYNRWGEKVFETDKPLRGWDGTYRGEIQNIDTYFYQVIAVSYLGEEVIRKGSLMLLK